MKIPVLALLAFQGFLTPLIHAEEAPSLPKPPPDWKVGIVAQAPRIHHPSALCVAPDGRIFVGQDPIDMMLPGDAAKDSVVCIHPDGRITTFAEGLHAVFGLAYLDGKLFVHHCPKLTVFTDDNGVGRDPVELFTTNPKPWGGTNLNDHIPANMRLGMDGYFYMSIGDKGVFGAVGKDGKAVDLLGGGVLRFRPDGTGLEVFATGTRNHLDVAINAEDEIFTYDNTDDGNGWWTRVTHMVRHGFYGYPFDYKPRRPYTLWMMKDYGGGSPTGAIAYNEDALPADYRGNLFMCEWGRRQLARFTVERDGATYKIVKRDEMADSGKAEFRPLGIDVSPDGMSLYVADWAYGGWRGKVDAGRVLKFTYTGKSEAQQKPAWWLPAAMGRAFNATPEQLVEGLKHPAQSVRLVAQRRLIDSAIDPNNTDLSRNPGAPHSGPDFGRGLEEVPLLIGLAKDTAAPPYARWSAIWTLDGITRDHLAAGNGRGIGSDAMSVSMELLDDPDRSVRLQAIRQLGSARHLSWLVPVQNLLNDPDPAIRFEAATTVGAFGNSTSVHWLQQKLGEPDLFTRFAIFTALNRIGRADAEVWPWMALGLGNEDPAIREGTLFAMRETFEVANVQALAGFVTNPKGDPRMRAEVLTTLAALHRQPPAWNGSWWGTQPVKNPPPARTVEWAGTPLVLAAVRAALNDPDAAVQCAAAQAVETTRDAESAPALRELYAQADPITARVILRSLGAIRDADAMPLLSAVFSSREENRELLPDAIVAAGRIGNSRAITALAQLLASHPGGEILKQSADALASTKSPEAMPALITLLRSASDEERATAIAALPRFGSDKLVPALMPLLDEPSTGVRRAAITALGGLKDKNLTPDLLLAWKNPGTREAAIYALAQAPSADALDAFLDALASEDDQLRDTGRKAIENRRSEMLALLEERHLKTPFEGQVLDQLRRAFASDPKAPGGPLFVGAPAEMLIASYEKWATRNPGDAERGRKLVHEGAAKSCLQCHRFENEGGTIGPDLTSIGAKYRRPQLIDSVLHPSKQIFDGYEVSIVTLKDGNIATGMVRQETPEELSLAQLDGTLRTIPREQVKETKRSAQSLMPEGLHATMSPQEFADLISYLESLHSEAEPGRE